MKIVFTCIIPALIMVCSGSVDAGEANTYAGQNAIDSLVDRAFYILNSAGDPASGMTQGQAVAIARNIAARLHTIAEHDPNRKYILFKTGELEHQIYLEEQGLLMEKEKYRQKAVSDLISRFNTALGKERPDFADLWSIQKMMAPIDTAMAIDVENSIKKRAAALAREIPSLIEKCLDEDKTDDARVPLAWCRVNRDFLGLSPSRYAALEAKLYAKTSADDERRQVIKGLDRFKTALRNNNLNNARMENLFLSEKIKTLRNNIQSYEWIRLNKDYELFASKYERKTDSLCIVAITLLRTRGPSSASAFLDTLRTIGLAIEKVNMVDRMILETVVAEKQRALADAAETGPVENDAMAAEEGNPMLGNLVDAARKRAQEKIDSQATDRKDRGRTTQIEEVRKDRLRTAFRLQQMRDLDAKQTDSAAALRELVAVYTSIEKREPKEARKRFEEKRELLCRNMPKEDFERVAQAVGRE